MRIGSFDSLFPFRSRGKPFGNAVMGEMTLLIGRLQFLYGDWLKIMK